MRLINVSTLELQEFLGDGNIPLYAILSHTWGNEEVTFQDWADLQEASKKAGYLKIRGCCDQAKIDNIDHVWVDTNSIDKTSSAELSEAINSMFEWYRASEVCYVYLADVSTCDNTKAQLDEFRRSRWFTRGWTLQELLASKEVIFYSRDWVRIGTKQELSKELSVITGIHERYIHDSGAIFSATIATRMSWLSNRVTTRVEDMAYCLLGIFNINMPLLYGERTNAFLRLQEEIIKVSDDQTIFCWSFAVPEVPDTWQNIFAPHPAAFRNAHGFVPQYRANEPITPYSITNSGLSLTLPILYTCNGICAVLNITWDDSDIIESSAARKATPLRAAIHLGKVGTRGHYTRIPFPAGPIPVVLSQAQETKQLFLRCRGIMQDTAPAAIDIASLSISSDVSTNTHHDEALFLTFSREIKVKGTCAPGGDGSVATAGFNANISLVWLLRSKHIETHNNEDKSRRTGIYLAFQLPKAEESHTWGMFIAVICDGGISDNSYKDTSVDDNEPKQSIPPRWYVEIDGTTGIRKIKAKGRPASTLSASLKSAESGIPQKAGGHFTGNPNADAVVVILQLPQFGTKSLTPCGLHIVLGSRGHSRKVLYDLDLLPKSESGDVLLYPTVRDSGTVRDPKEKGIGALDHLDSDSFFQMF
jgi:hypothetical protein